jgi:predicted Ser/Thr protein kinase
MRLCLECQTENDESNSFCVNCGNVLQTAPPVVLTDKLPEKTASEKPTEILPADNKVVTTQDVLPITVSTKSAETVDMHVGKVLDHRYRLDALIKSGGMGKVFRGTRLNLNDLVAIKVLHPEYTSDQQAIERFRREAQTAALLKHPNTVSVYDFGISEEGFCYIVMEFVEGVSLREVLKERGVLPLTEAVAVTNQIASALEEAHRMGVVHRDLKPDNIIVQQRADGLKVKILDFGIAKIHNIANRNLTQTGFVIGTPRYMSPEQCLGENLDGRADIYSLGIMLYEMLTGATPFNSPTTEALFAQHVSQQPVPLRSHNWSVSPNVEAVILKALQKKREARQQTAAQLAFELQTAIVADEAETKPSSLPPQPQPFISPTRTKQPWVLIALLAVLSLFLIGIVGVLAYPYIKDALTKKSAPLPDHFGIFYSRQDGLTELKMREFKNALNGSDELQADTSLPIVAANPTLLLYYETQMVPSSELKLIKLDSVNEDGKVEYWDYQISPLEGKPEIKQIKIKDGLPKGKFAFALLKDYLDEGTHKFWCFQIVNGAANPASPQILALSLKPKPSPMPQPTPSPTPKPTPQTPKLPSGPMGVCNENNVVMRAAPTQSSAKVGRLDRGSQVVILQYSSNYETWRGITSNFVYVQTTGGKRGWVFSPFISAN